MSERIYIGDDEQYVPDLARWVLPGDSVEFPVPPDETDPRWATAAKAKPLLAELKARARAIEKAKAPVVEPEAAPVTETPAETEDGS